MLSRFFYGKELNFLFFIFFEEKWRFLVFFGFFGGVFKKFGNQFGDAHKKKVETLRTAICYKNSDSLKLCD
jgi:hypothetical protein